MHLHVAVFLCSETAFRLTQHLRDSIVTDIQVNVRFEVIILTGIQVSVRPVVTCTLGHLKADSLFSLLICICRFNNVRQGCFDSR